MNQDHVATRHKSESNKSYAIGKGTLMNGRLILKLKEKKYRDAYVGEHLSNVVSSQIHKLRTSRALSQQGLGKMIGTSQNVISRLEDPDYGKFSLQTLLKLASAFDVALTVKFIGFGKFVSEFEDISPDNITVRSFAEEMSHSEMPEFGKTDQSSGSTVTTIADHTVAGTW